MCKLVNGLLLALMLGGMLTSSVRGQELAVGRIKGIVRDPSGAIVVGASVVALHESTGVQMKSVTNGAGEYSFESLKIGSYAITVSMSGFSTAVRNGVRIVSG